MIYLEIKDGVAVEAANYNNGVTPVGLIAQGSTDATIGWLWDGTDWTAPTVSVDELRVVRDELLASSDFTQLPDVHSATMRATWATYRQELRDLPDGYTPVADPVYPTKP